MNELPTDPQPPKKPRRPLGKPIAWTEADIAEMSIVTGHDKQAAAALWRNEAPPWARDLLEATETKEGR